MEGRLIEFIIMALPVNFFRSADDSSIDDFGLEPGGLYLAEDTMKLYYAMPNTGAKELIKSHVHLNFTELDTIPKGSDLGDWLRRLEALEKDKQDKLVAGKYITISEANVIDCNIDRVGEDDINEICSNNN